MDERLSQLLRDTTPRQLLTMVLSGEANRDLPPAARDELLTLLQAWDQRALSEVPLRDALLVDPERGVRVYQLLAGSDLDPSLLRAIEQLPLNAPEPWQPPETDFLLASPQRRALAMLLALIGALLLGLPLLVGEIPHHPAGIPLALITLALLIGIGASWPGYLGSALIWLVPNLPSFHHSVGMAFWPTLPLLAFGLILLSLDHNVRRMWRSLRRHLGSRR
jgi:hypothetical protein